jgi:hypothetical protein
MGRHAVPTLTYAVCPGDRPDQDPGLVAAADLRLACPKPFAR